jgi:phytanoyl-CoA hydroxylase
MLNTSQIEEFRANGFVLGGSVLNDKEVNILRAELDRVIADRDNPNRSQPVRLFNPEAAVWQIVNIWEASEAFRELIYHPQIVEEIAQLTDATELRVWHDQIQIKPEDRRNSVNMWHQDSPLWPILNPNTSQVSAWIPFTDVGESNGCMSMVAGSYRWGDQMAWLRHSRGNGYDAMPSHFEGNKIRVVRRPVQKGHVHYHHSLTWHGSHANTSGRPRPALAIHYMTQETHYDASGEHIMKPFARVADGEPLTGDHFPLVWANGSPMKP